jgi:aminoglycoside 3-N-acetyltransferase
MPAMGEVERIRASRAPVTRAGLAADLERLGVRSGGVLVVHASLSALGWVCGGAQAVVEALLDAVGETGTVVVPTHTNNNSDPAEWLNPPVPDDWWPAIREHMPAYDPGTTPSPHMGAIAETLRARPDARRSAHPHYSFAAVGPHADEITTGHELERGFGAGSPLARVDELDGDVLLLGVDHGANSSLHVAETRLPVPARERSAGAVATAAGRRWLTWEDVVPDEHDFAALGAEFDATGATRVGPVGEGEGRLMRQRELLEFAVPWLVAHRGTAR